MPLTKSDFASNVRKGGASYNSADYTVNPLFENKWLIIDTPETDGPKLMLCSAARCEMKRVKGERDFVVATDGTAFYSDVFPKSATGEMPAAAIDEFLKGMSPEQRDVVKADIQSVRDVVGTINPDAAEQARANVQKFAQLGKTTAPALAAMSTLLPAVDDMEIAFDRRAGELRKLAAVEPAVGKPGKYAQDDPNLGLYDVFDFEGKVQPVMLLGDKGLGKSYAVSAYADIHNAAYFEMQLHNSVESWEFLGHVTKRTEGGVERMLWKDGPIAQAFRSAESGVPTVLLLDEILRVPSAQLSALLSAFAPRNGKYFLPTGQVLEDDGSMATKMEVLEAPVKNLRIIATTNIGMDYDVYRLDPAIEDRFHMHYMEYSEDERQNRLRDILKRTISDGPLSPDAATRDAVSSKMTELLGKLENANAQGIFPKSPSLRLCINIAQIAAARAEETEQSPLAAVREAALRKSRALVGLSQAGKPIEAQVKAYEVIVNSVFGGGGRANTLDGGR